MDRKTAELSAPSPDARDHLVVFLNGRRRTVTGASVFSMLSDHLRSELHLAGTKVVCAEGDCGACTVLVGRPEGGSLRYRTVNACIQALHQLDGCHVVTVEGLRDGGRLHPVQRAMIDCHGSQCGYCTPGFVMSLAGLYESCPRPTAADVRHACTGNLCRCTGYVSIVEAGLSAAERPDTGRRISEMYPPGPIAADLAESALAPVFVRAGGRTYFSARTLDQAVAFKAAHPEAVIISGGTELGVWANKRDHHPAVLMSLAAVPGLDRIAADGRSLTIGANVTWTQIEDFAAGRLPEFAEIARRFGSPQIRNVGTLAGNIANGSPIADGLPFLMVCGAVLDIAGPRGVRTVPLDGFYKGYKVKDLAADEILTAVRLTLPEPDERLKLYKASKRAELDISTVGAAIRIDARGGEIRSAAVALAGVGPTVARAPATEAFLLGKPFAEETFAAAAEVVRSEIHPIGDVRGSAEFRRLLAGNFLRKFWCDAGAGAERFQM